MAKIIKSAETASASQHEAETTTNVTNPTPVLPASAESPAPAATKAECKFRRKDKLDYLADYIKPFLEAHAAEDTVWAETKYLKNGKTLRGCAAWLLEYAREHAQNGCACFTDAEGIGHCIHFFDEDSITEPSAAAKKTSTQGVKVATAAEAKPKAQKDGKKADKKPAKKTSSQPKNPTPQPQPQAAQPEQTDLEKVRKEYGDIFAYAAMDKTLELF